MTLSTVERYEWREYTRDGWPPRFRFGIWDNLKNDWAVIEGRKTVGLTRWEARQTAGLLNNAKAGH